VRGRHVTAALGCATYQQVSAADRAAVLDLLGRLTDRLSADLAPAT